MRKKVLVLFLLCEVVGLMAQQKDVYISKSARYSFAKTSLPKKQKFNFASSEEVFSETVGLVRNSFVRKPQRTEFKSDFSSMSFLFSSRSNQKESPINIEAPFMSLAIQKRQTSNSDLILDKPFFSDVSTIVKMRDLPEDPDNPGVIPVPIPNGFLFLILMAGTYFLLLCFYSKRKK